MLEQQQQQGAGWLSAASLLPGPDLADSTFVVIVDGAPRIAVWRNGGFHDPSTESETSSPTLASSHWIPLPPPPIRPQA